MHILLAVYQVLIDLQLGLMTFNHMSFDGQLFGPHEYVYSVKTVIENMFILYSGSLQIERWEDKIVSIERTLVAPEVFGEQFVLFDKPAARSALTLTFCEVAILQRVNFIRALRMFPECMAPVRVRLNQCDYHDPYDFV